MQAYLVDVFTQTPGKGNPGAVVLDSKGLSTSMMGGIAAKLGLETAFVDGTTLRYYTPSARPMVLCGHATLAALSVMGRQGRFTVSTPAGDLQVEAEPHCLGMAMPAVTFGDPLNPEIAATALDIPADEIVMPVRAVGAGRPKLLVPVRSLSVLDGLVPDPVQVAEACAATGTTGLYPFTLQVRSPGATADARQFPSGAGILEDPVTGVAAVALAWYLWEQRLAPGGGALTIEQGHAMGRPGQVLVKREPDGHTWIYGNAVVAKSMEV